jgi:hypothetical protein
LAAESFENEHALAHVPSNKPFQRAEQHCFEVESFHVSIDCIRFAEILVTGGLKRNCVNLKWLIPVQAMGIPEIHDKSYIYLRFEIYDWIRLLLY